MANPRDPFREALDSLRARVTDGLYAPGRPVVIVEEARRLGLSTTPVREALACLCGEGLMDRTPRAGYLAPRLDAALLRDRYWVRLRCLTESLNLTAGLPAPPGISVADTAGDGEVRDLFERMVRQTGNRALIEVLQRVDAQLRTLGQAEARVFADTDIEARILTRIGHVGSRIQLLTAIEAYHRRRMESAAVIVLEVERPRSQSLGGG